jgi:ribosomal-protein-alanine N-acetyltransferase
VTAAGLARLHAACFTTPRPWSRDEFSALLAEPGSILTVEASGFALGRVILDEAELLTIAVDPSMRRKGLGRRLLAGFLDTAAARGARSVFLEVAADNAPAMGLYLAAGFAKVGLRPGYYRDANGRHADAVLLRRDGDV